MRSAAATLLALMLCLAAPASAGAAASCAFDPESHVLEVTAPDYYGTKIERSGDLIAVTGGSNAPAARSSTGCADLTATVHNTDRIEVTGSFYSIRIDLSGGPLAPGFSPEADGSPEIEVTVNSTSDRGRARVGIEGSSAADDIRMGTADGVSSANLNAGEAVGDADVVLMGGPVYFEAQGREGDDVIDSRGGAGTGTGLVQDSQILLGGPGNDVMSGGMGTTFLWDEAGDDTLRAGARQARLIGGRGDDTMIGSPEADDFSDPEGNDKIAGGDGVDTLDFGESYNPAVRVDLQVTGPQDTGRGVDTISGIEYVEGTIFQDVFAGTDAAETFDGFGGDDVFAGRGGRDVYLGGTGRDVADYSDAPGPVAVDLRKPALATGAAGTDKLFDVESVVGSAHADRLTGNAFGNVLDGGTGKDVLRGHDGPDTILPGSTRSGTADGGDDADGGWGTDTLSYATRLFRVAVRLDGVRNDGADPNRDGVSSAAEESDLIAGFENVVGGGGADLLAAPGPEVNFLTGGAGADFLDAFDGTSAVDRLNCGLGADTYRADPKDFRAGCEGAAR